MANKVTVVISGENQLGNAVRAASRDLGGLNQTVNSLKGALGALGVGLSLAGLVAIAKQAVDAENEMYRLTQKTGMTAETLSALAYSAKQSEVDIDTMSKGLKFLSKAMEEAHTGNKELRQVFADLGVTFEDAKTKQLLPLQNVLLQLADVFSRSKDGPEKLVAALKLLGGRSGQELIVWLNGGRDAVLNLTKAQQDGVIISTAAAARAAELHDELARMEEGTKGLVREFMNGLIPTLRELSKEFNAAAEDGRAFSAGSGIGQWATEAKNMLGKAGAGVSSAVLQIDLALAKAEKAKLAIDEALNRKTGGLMGQPVADELQQAKARVERVELDLQRMRAIYKHYSDELRGYQAPNQPVQPPPGPRLARAHETTTFLQPVASHGPGVKGEIRLTDPNAAEKAAEQAKRQREADSKLAEAKAEYDLSLAQNAQKTQLTILESAHRQGLISLSQYFAQREQITDQGYQREMDALVAKLEVQQKLVAQTPAGPERTKAKAEIEKVYGELTKKESEWQQATAQGAAEQFEAQQQLTDFILQTEAEIRQAKGDTTAVAIANIQKEFEAKRRSYQAEGRPTGELDALEQQRIAGARAEALAQQIEGVQARLGIEQQRIAVQVQNHQLTELQGEQAINQKRQEAKDLLDQMVLSYGELAQASGDPRLVAGTEQFKLSLDELAVKSSMVRETIFNSLANAGTEFATVFTTNMAEAGQGFREFANSVISDIARMYTRMLVLWALQKAMGFFFPTGPSLAAVQSVGSTRSAFPSWSMPALRDSGGPILAGSAYRVGVPELIVPSFSGAAIPLSKLSGAPIIRGGDVIIDARGAGPGERERLEIWGRKIIGEAVQRSVTVVQQMQKRW